MTYITEKNIIYKSTLTCLEYEKLFNNANDAIFFVEADKNAVPKCFIEVNERGCDLLGYSKEEFLQIVPLSICVEIRNKKYSSEEILIICKNLLNKKKDSIEATLIAKDGHHISIEVNLHVFELNKKIVYLAIARDITERKKIENTLKESEESYRQIVNLSPDAIIIIVDDKIVLANKKALKHCDKLIGESVFKFAPDYKKTINKRINQLLENKKIKATFDYKIIDVDKSITDVEVSSNYLIYQGKQAIVSTIRDITKKKNGLNAAAKSQRQDLQKSFPCSDKVKIETVYAPAKTVSGDFFCIIKVDEDLVVGILADVSGKGITAALNISAFNVLFHEAVLISHNPFDIVNNLNKKVTDYVGERYIAACCFSLDFKNNKAKIVGAGINEFVFQNSQHEYDERIIKGPFLGMFEDSLFDEQIIDFKSGDRFYLFTDGLDFIFDNNQIRENYMKRFTIGELKNYINNSLNDMLTDIDGIKDDCTLLAMKIK